MIMAYFERKGCVHRTSIQTVYHYEKVLKASNIVWFVSSACNLRGHWPECVGHVPVNRTFYFTGAIDILQCAIGERPISI